MGKLGKLKGLFLPPTPPSRSANTFNKMRTPLASPVKSPMRPVRGGIRPVSSASGQQDDARTVDRLCTEGEALCAAGNFGEAEEKFKAALLLDQNDTRTLLHYAVMLRDQLGAAQRAEQLLKQAMGDNSVFVSVGMTGPANQRELDRAPKVVSPKKDMQLFEFRRQAMRSTVRFHDLRPTSKLMREVRALEKDQREGHDEGQAEREDEENDKGHLLNQSATFGQPQSSGTKEVPTGAESAESSTP